MPELGKVIREMKRRIVLVHGAWHGGWAWEEVVPRLNAIDRHLEVEVVELPSAGGHGDLHTDVGVVREVLGDDDLPTTVVGHSYGGMVMSQAAAGFAHVERLVYLAAFMLEEGQSLASLSDDLGVGTPPWWRIDATAGLVRAADPMTIFYNGLDPIMAASWIQRLRPQSMASFEQPLTVASWRDVPSVYVTCSDDNAIPLVLQKAMAQRATEVVDLVSGHSPFGSCPDAVADVIAAAAVTDADRPNDVRR